MKRSCIVSSNWKALSTSINKPTKKRRSKKHPNLKKLLNEEINNNPNPSASSSLQKLEGSIISDEEDLTRIVALDCEMVGSGPDGKDDLLARVSIVNSHGRVVFDSFVSPSKPVTNYRTFCSGIRKKDLKNAPSFKSVQAAVSKIIKGKTVVGHALHNDFRVLVLNHPRDRLRDTSLYKPLRKNGRPRALRHLIEEYLGYSIQESEHSSVEDARANMLLYKKLRKEWEKDISLDIKAKKSLKNIETILQKK